MHIPFVPRSCQTLDINKFANLADVARYLTTNVFNIKRYYAFPVIKIVGWVLEHEGGELNRKYRSTGNTADY